MGLLPVVPMTLISGMLMIVVSLATRDFALPSEPTLRRYFFNAKAQAEAQTSRRVPATVSALPAEIVLAPRRLCVSALRQRTISYSPNLLFIFDIADVAIMSHP